MPTNSVDIFHGDGREGENPQNFLRAFRREMRSLTTTDDKEIAGAFVDYLGASSQADLWFEDLEPGTKESWTLLETAFIARWPRITKAKRSEQEIERELLSTLLEEKELGEKVKIGGVEVWSHVAWADKIAILVNEADIATKTTHIWQVRDKLPYTIKDVVKSTHTDWTAFLQAVRDVDLQHIRDAVAKRKKEDETRRALENRIRILETVQQSPTAGIHSQMNRASISLQQTPAQYPANSRRANEAVFGQSGGQGTLFGPRAGQAPAARPTPTPQQIAALRGRLNILPHHPNTDGGRAAYRLQLTEWEGRHGRDTRVTEETPYPLRPGTAPVCAGECWICGMTGHRRDRCQAQPGSQACISPRENLWRRICGTMLGPINRENATPVQHVAVDQYGYALGTPWAVGLEPTEAIEQGKEEGSSA
jgi:hypothetical protein